MKKTVFLIVVSVLLGDNICAVTGKNFMNKPMRQVTLAECVKSTLKGRKKLARDILFDQAFFMLNEVVHNPARWQDAQYKDVYAYYRAELASKIKRRHLWNKNGIKELEMLAQGMAKIAEEADSASLKLGTVKMPTKDATRNVFLTALGKEYDLTSPAKKDDVVELVYPAVCPHHAPTAQEEKGPSLYENTKKLLSYMVTDTDGKSWSSSAKILAVVFAALGLQAVLYKERSVLLRGLRAGKEIWIWLTGKKCNEPRLIVALPSQEEALALAESLLVHEC